MFCNDRQGWVRSAGAAGRQRRDAIYADDFTSQWSLAGTFGYLQMTYIRANDLRWSGSSLDGSKNPSLLFDSDENLAVNGGSLPLGCLDITQHFRRKYSSISSFPNDAFSTPANFLETFKQAWRQYNKRTAYPDEVAARVPGFVLVNPAPLF
jgi:hypothetical protein